MFFCEKKWQEKMWLNVGRKGRMNERREKEEESDDDLSQFLAQGLGF